MNNQFFIYIYFEGIILQTAIGCIFESRQQIGMKFNKNVKLNDMKQKISAKIVRRCESRMPRLFYKFPVSSNS